VEDQGGVGFAVQDAVVFSTTSCFFGNFTAQYNLAVRVFAIYIFKFYIRRNILTRSRYRCAKV
jgi:hypothetical protein